MLHVPGSSQASWKRHSCYFLIASLRLGRVLGKPAVVTLSLIPLLHFAQSPKSQVTLKFILINWRVSFARSFRSFP